MKYYKISETQLLGLLKDTCVLQGLESSGVDNWQGYGYLNEILADFPKPTLQGISESYEEVV